MRLRFLKYRTCQRGLVIVSTTTRITILCEFTFEVNFTIVILISDYSIKLFIMITVIEYCNLQYIKVLVAGRGENKLGWIVELCIRMYDLVINIKFAPGLLSIVGFFLSLTLQSFVPI